MMSQESSRTTVTTNVGFQVYVFVLDVCTVISSVFGGLDVLLNHLHNVMHEYSADESK